MPRPLRIEFENAYYHVMNRGANRQDIFECDRHRKIFYSVLEEIVERFNIEIHAFCLMTNHYHLLVKTLLGNLSRVMRHLDGIYTQRFNRITKRDGPLFRGRYKAILIDSDQYFLQVSRYIHLNPVSAKICKKPENYKWSSMRLFFNKEEEISWVNISFTLNQMNSKNKRVSYLAYVNEGVDEETYQFYHKKKLASIYGGKRFIDDKLSNLVESYIDEVSTDVKYTKSIPGVDEIFDQVKCYFQITSFALYENKQGKKNVPKMITIYLLRQLRYMTNKDISSIFPGIKSVSVSPLIARLKMLISIDPVIKNHVENLIRGLSC